MIPTAILTLVTALAATPPAVSATDPSCGRIDLPLQSQVVVYQLPRTFLRAGSDSVTVRGVHWLREHDYVLDPLRGELRLLREPIPGDTLEVWACWLLAPPPLERETMRYRPPSGVPDTSAADTANTAATVPRAGVSLDRLDGVSGMNLSVAGSKTVAIEFGSNQDAFLRQSLDLTLSGALAPGVELTGVLSDRNTPLTMTGSTQDLQALDHVLLELKTPNGGAQLGDVTLSLAQGEFARIDRRLQGVRGDWHGGSGQATFTAAQEPGQYRRMEFYGTEGFQGPYPLTAANGGTAISIVAASEIVTLDGERLRRGEAADYSIDYDLARLTFTQRRPISSTSRVTVEFQYSGDQYRRRLMAGGSRWERGGAYLYTGFLGESDDRGRPLEATLGASDLAALALAGDSTAYAVVDGVSSSGGDYDTTRVDSARVAYRYVGAGEGRYSVPFHMVGAGHGDYEAYPVTSGTAYRFVGADRGSYRVGRTLPLPESHQLWNGGVGTRAGPLVVDVEGALSRLDRNTFSALDDGDNTGGALRARLGLETPHPEHGRSLGIAGLLRAVDPRFAAFGSLSGSFEAERWGLAPGADIDHRREAGVEAHASDPRIGALTGSIGRLETPNGYASDRGEARFQRDGLLSLNAAYAHAAGSTPGVAFGRGGLERADATVAIRGAWLQPSFRLLNDERRAPGDSTVQGMRTRSAAFELASGTRWPWFASAGIERRHDERLEVVSDVNLGVTRVLSAALRSPEQRALGGELRLQRRMRGPGEDPSSSRSDLGTLRLRGDDRARGLTSRVDLELTGEGESRRQRIVSFVGPGLGGYDSLGNFVGTGDYAVAIGVAPGFDRVSRAATSAHVAWEFTPSEAWRGSHVGFDFETETRRRGDLAAGDPWITPVAVLTDTGLTRGSLVQRLEGETAPASRIAAFQLRLERRVTSDRLYENFSQTLDDRQATLRWRTRPSGIVTTELEGHARRQAAVQELSGASTFSRTLIESGGEAQWVVTPGAGLRVAAVCNATWSRPENVRELTRTVKVGPDLGLAVGPRGHAELSARRAFVTGAPPVALIPTNDPAGAPAWQGNGRFDYRVRESTTVGIFTDVQKRDGRRPIVTGRAEVRAFF